MNPLLMLDNVSLAYGLHPLLDHVKFQIGKGERVCLIGRNGAGKSSLLKIIEGVLLPDAGNVWRQPHLRIARLAQELPSQDNLTIYDYVAEGLAESGQLLREYHAITHLAQHTDADLARMEKLQNAIDACNGWLHEQQISNILTRLELDADKLLSQLSGGWQRRAALARALVATPDLLLLDEPTNHLDIDAIQWLEDQLLASGCALLFITHDRALLQRLATRIIELDRGNLTSWTCDYQTFLLRKEEMLHAEAKQNADFDKKLAQEEVWIRQGIKARRTRNEGRVRALEAMRLERSKRRNVQGKAVFEINAGDKSGQVVAEAKDVTQIFGDKIVIKNFSQRIMRGDRIGLIGPNGAGKSTLLNILLGKIIPQQGSVIQGTNLQIAYFDQQRETLDLEKNVMDNVVEGSEFIEINGQKKHVMSYLGDFLFAPQRARTPVKALSGGECNRLLLAKLFSKPANVLVMDEPTNDLDMETLELLEELLANFNGTLLLVSHDRAFLDNVVTSTLVFEGNGVIQEYIGGYQDWLRQKKPLAEVVKMNKSIEKTVKTEAKKSVKLSYREQKELEELPQQIEKLDEEEKMLQEKMSQSDFYKQEQSVITASMTRLQEIQDALKKCYARWEELEKRQGE